MHSQQVCISTAPKSQTDKAPETKVQVQHKSEVNHVWIGLRVQLLLKICNSADVQSPQLPLQRHPKGCFLAAPS